MSALPHDESDPVRRTLQVARGQSGAIDNSQLDAAGFHRGAVRRALQRGWLEHAAASVYVVGGSPNTVEQRQWVGLLALGPGTMVSHEAAARIHGFDQHRSDVVEFTAPRTRRNANLPFPVHTTTRLGPTDQVHAGGFPVTSATRTILDLARARIPRRRLIAAIDSSVRLRLSAPIVLRARLAGLRGPGRWGVRLIDSLLPDSGGESPLEREFLGLMARHGIPRPRTQVVFRRDARIAARVDFLFEEHGLVVEVSGRRGHASDAERAADAQRRNELQELGLAVYEFTRDDVTRRPDYVVTMLTTRLT